MSMPQTVRHINEKRALAALLRAGTLSRADLARELGLTRSTASSIVAGLMQDGLVRDADLVRGAGETAAEPPNNGDTPRIGRPGTLLTLNGAHGTFIGVDLGIDHLHLLALDFAGRVLMQERATMDPSAMGPERMAETLVKRIAGFRERLGTAGPARGLCVSVPGVVDERGLVLRLPILGWTGWPLREALRRAFPDIAEIEVENDANAFAVADGLRDSARAGARSVHLLLDAGVGGAILADGALQRGAHGYAGEIGHMPVGDKGFLPEAALPGSLESFVGRDAILHRYRDLGGAGDLDALLADIQVGEASAHRCLGEWAHYLGRGLATITALIDPGEIVLGGPVAALFAAGEAEVAQALARHLLPGQPLPALRLSRSGAEGAALGGAALLHRRHLSVDEDFVFRRADPDQAEASTSAEMR